MLDLKVSFGWIIDVDHMPEDGAKLGTNLNAAGIMGPRAIRPEVEARLLSADGVKFRMYDDDDNLMYSGRFWGDSESEDAFAPLDDFGTPNAGCTYIKYLRGNKWETL